MPSSKTGASFKCGNPRHRAADCWSQLSSPKAPASPLTSAPKDGKQVVCFICRAAGYKANECPQRKQNKCNKTFKRVELQPDELEGLQSNKVVGQIGRTVFPVTLDSGAEISLMPIEHIPRECISKEIRTANWGMKDGAVMHGKVAYIDMILGGIDRTETVLAVPGKDVGETSLFSLDPLQESTRDLLRQLKASKKQMLAGATWEQPWKADKQEDQHEGEVLGSV